MVKWVPEESSYCQLPRITLCSRVKTLVESALLSSGLAVRHRGKNCIFLNNGLILQSPICFRFQRLC